ncbi:hypothetical protein SAMN04490183_4516 [Pseudomonas corrugata]|uniref:Uncharacterized protein n=1 Tax=Pseudomonas syringae pv. castaneae TaxID=264450 RepID=A0A0N8R5E9_PSESX|nr:hypothetical protein ALO79_200141 [Pseudomonas syringae pv. castaneae]SDV08385.1 hypothetical protein SAMN04490183_4516 [Pseudomonas corrugata]
MNPTGIPLAEEANETFVLHRYSTPLRANIFYHSGMVIFRKARLFQIDAIFKVMSFMRGLLR